MNRRAYSFGLSGLLTLLMCPALLFQQPATAAAGAGPCAASTFAVGQIGGAIVNGQLYTWGRNYEGELGLGVRGGVIGTPTPVPSTTGLSTVTGFWPGFQTTFATDASGHVWGWGGFNSRNERGNSNGNNIPQPVLGPSHVVSIGAGNVHTIALQADGTMWGWGEPSYLGLSASFPATPTSLSGPAHIVKVAAGDSFSLALAVDGTLYAVGRNNLGQLGLGQGVSAAATFQGIPGLAQINDMAASSAGGTEFSVALDGNGHVFAFGSNFYGQMGNGSASPSPQFTPTQVQGLDSVVQVAAGLGHVLALKSDGTVWAWGLNETGQLGNDSKTNSPSPALVTFPAGVQIQRIAAGWSNSMALDTQGHLWGWGYNGDGTVGNGFILAPPVVKPVQLSLGPVANRCAPPAPKSYLPSINGYSFTNPGNPNLPSYERMAAFFPSSSWEMYWPISHKRTFIGKKFYSDWFVPTYAGAPGFAGGLCYGMSASDQFLYNHFPNQSVVALYPFDPNNPGAPGTGLDSPFPGGLGASPSPADATIQDFIERYHSRQLAASGVLASIQSWKDIEKIGGNRTALSVVADVIATGKTEWLGIGPSSAALTHFGKDRFQRLFNESHAVLAYGVNIPAKQIRVYDPNNPLDDHAYIQIVDSPINTGGGIQLIHHADTTPDMTYGGGIVNGVDLGQPGEWTLMPLPDQAFSDDGIIAGQDNRHWFVDALPAIAITIGGTVLPFSGTPVFRMLDVRTPDHTFMEALPSNTGLNTTVAASAPGSTSAQITNTHSAEAIQTDSGAAGASHQVAVSPNADRITLSAASRAETFTTSLSNDFLTSSYGRQVTVIGAMLLPGGTLDLGVDATFSSLAVAPSGMPRQRATLTLEQGGQGEGSTTVALTIPGDSAQGNVFVGDWTQLGSSLIFEVITASDGSVTGLLLQDNPAQRKTLTVSLLQQIHDGLAPITNDGIRASLQSKLDNASRQVDHNPAAAANMLGAMWNEIAAQTGKAIDPAQAASLDSTLLETIGLLRAPLG